jgi:hypothetical protein
MCVLRGGVDEAWQEGPSSERRGEVSTGKILRTQLLRFM